MIIGVERSPLFYSGYGYIDARKPSSEIIISGNTKINNSVSVISDGCRIMIGKDCLIGFNVSILDSDFHDLEPDCRFGGTNVLKGNITINDNVFLGNDVTVLKRVSIGKNTVVANGSIVTRSLPANIIAAGVPARKIKEI